MIERRDEIENAGATAMLVAYDEPPLLNSKVLRNREVPFPLLLNPEKSAYRSWGLGRTNAWVRTSPPPSPGGI